MGIYLREIYTVYSQRVISLLAFYVNANNLERFTSKVMPM